SRARRPSTLYGYARVLDSVSTRRSSDLETRARELGYFVYLTLTHKKPELEKEYIRYLVDRKVDGIILMSVNKGKDFEKYLRNLKDRKSTRLNSSHVKISYAVFCLRKNRD